VSGRVGKAVGAGGCDEVVGVGEEVGVWGVWGGWRVLGGEEGRCVWCWIGEGAFGEEADALGQGGLERPSVGGMGEAVRRQDLAEAEVG